MPKKRQGLDPQETARLISHTGPRPSADQPDEQDDQKDPAKSLGVGLRTTEWERYADIAADLGMTQHKLAAYALRYFLAKYEAGEIPLETRKTLPKLKE